MKKWIIQRLDFIYFVFWKNEYVFLTSQLEKWQSESKLQRASRKDKGQKKFCQFRFWFWSLSKNFVLLTRNKVFTSKGLLTNLHCWCLSIQIRLDRLSNNWDLLTFSIRSSISISKPGFLKGMRNSWDLFTFFLLFLISV